MNRFNPRSRRHSLLYIATAWTIGIALACLMAAHDADGSEKANNVTIESVLSAIVSVESGCVRIGTGDIRGKWERGEAGEVSPFQLHQSVLTDLGVLHKSERIHRDPVLAESYARLWLVRLHNRYGNWPDSIAAWHRGPSGFRQRSARAYSRRVMNLAQSL